MKQTFITGFILCFFGAIISSGLSAQEYTNFDLSKYYTPDIVRNSLDLNFSLNENIISRKTPDSTTLNLFNWNLRPMFTRYENTRKRITNISIGGTTSGSSNNNFKINNNDFAKSIYTTDGLSISYSSYFYNPNQFFLMLKVNGDYDGVYSNIINSTNSLETTTLNSQNTYSISPSIGIGKGRIESVTDARQAIYILDELTKKGKITRTLTENEIFRFAQTISKVKNKRFLDARLRKIEEISTVDSFLLKSGYLTDQDATYFTTLYDFWDYGALFSRNSGQSFEVNLTPYANLDNSRYKPISLNTGDLRNNQEYKAEINFIYKLERVVGLNWQHSFSSSLNFHISDVIYETTYEAGSIDKTNGTNLGGTFNANYNLSYFPSTRSRFSLYVNQSNILDFNNHITINNIEQPKNQMSNMMSRIGISADYYFSPQLRLSGSAGIDYSYSTYSSGINENKNLSGGIGASISYSFF